MIKENILLLLKQRLISRWKFEKETGLNIKESFSCDYDSCDDAKIAIISKYFNVSKTFFGKKLRYNFLIKIANLLISIVFLASLAPLIFIYANKSVDLIYLLITPLITCSILVPIMIYYRKFSLSVLLLIPILFSFYLLGLYTMYTGVLKFDGRLTNILLG